MPPTTLPPKLAELVEEFAAVGANDRLQLLMELADELPELPARFAGHPEQMERVVECQSPLYLAVELEDGPGRPVRLFFDAPPAGPTTRGFASIMSVGLDGALAADVLAVPDDFHVELGLDGSVSPLRLRGMVAMLGRIKRQVRAAASSLNPQ